MHCPLYHVDAFADRLFTGNPAGVVLLDAWLPADVMQAVAGEMHLSETAFLGPVDSVDVGPGRTTGGDASACRYGLRWFTPTTEVNLCGHATLAAGHVVLLEQRFPEPSVSFLTRSGPLTVSIAGGARLAMDFPAIPSAPIEAPAGLVEGLGATPSAVRIARGDAAADVVAIFDDASQVRALQVDTGALAAIDARAVAVTAPGDEDGIDFVSRFFAPRCGVPEDPVTGSAHCILAPYWAERLGRRELHAVQRSARGGHVHCVVGDERVSLQGTAVTWYRTAARMERT